MQLFIFILLLSVVILSSAKPPNYESPKKLISLHLVYRHGARTPVGGYPNDPYINETYFPYGLGQLNNYGKQQLFQTGQWLRKTYGDFLGTLYQYDQVYVQSTDVPRTKASTALLLAGLYPPQYTRMDWNNGLNWQPIPIYSAPLDSDLLLYVPPCPRYSEAIEELWQLPEVRKPYEGSLKKFSELAKYSGYPLEGKNLLSYPLQLWDILYTEQEFGLQLPKWTKDYFPNWLQQFYELGYLYSTWTPELKRLKGGPFVQLLITNWLARIANNETHKIFLFGAHDVTVAYILGSLNLWTPQIPVYGIMAVFELRQDEWTGEYGIQIYQKVPGNDTVNPLTLPGCEYFCPIQKFITLTRNIIPTNLTQACIPRNPNFTVS